eukprot:gene4246-4665_t
MNQSFVKGSFSSDFGNDVREGEEDENEEEEKQEEESSSSSSSSSSQEGGAEEDSEVDDLQSADVKWRQMKKNALNRRHNRQKGKGSRLAGLLSLNEIKRGHGLKRMKKGLEVLLSLHHPVELSSICGCLNLPVQQKGPVSLSAILKFATADGGVNEERIRQILHFCYEGVIWEYLHSIGHPVFSIITEPREAVLLLWREGGLLEGEHSFTPHFLPRHVLPRYKQSYSQDITEYLSKISLAEVSVKEMERKMMSQPDYQHILSYFKAMTSLRAVENSCRQSLIEEIEVLRSHRASSDANVRLAHDLVRESELQMIRLSEKLNEELAYYQSLYEESLREKCTILNECYRLTEVLESFHEALEDRQLPSGGRIQPLKLRSISQCHGAVRSIFQLVQDYKEKWEDYEGALRWRCRCHCHELRRFEEENKTYQTRIDQLQNYNQQLEKRIQWYQRQYRLSERALIRSEEGDALLRLMQEERIARLAAENCHFERKMKKIKPILISGTRHSHETVKELCLLIYHFLFQPCVSNHVTAAVASLGPKALTSVEMSAISLENPSPENRTVPSLEEERYLVEENRFMANEDYRAYLCQPQWRMDYQQMKRSQQQQQLLFQQSSKTSGKGRGGKGGNKNGVGSSKSKQARNASSGSASASRDPNNQNSFDGGSRPSTEDGKKRESGNRNNNTGSKSPGKIGSNGNRPISSIDTSSLVVDDGVKGKAISGNGGVSPGKPSMSSSSVHTSALTAGKAKKNK